MGDVRTENPRPNIPPYIEHRRSPIALSLVELLLALAITAVIGLAIAAMMFATARGTQTESGLMNLVIRQRVVTHRLNAALRSSTTLLASGYDAGDNQDYLVLWISDEDESEKPNLAELRLIEYDRSLDTLTAYAASYPNDTVKAANNPEYELNADFRAAVETAKAGSYFPGVVWAEDVTAMAYASDGATVQESKLVSYRLTLTGTDVEEVALGAAALRNAIDN